MYRYPSKIILINKKDIKQWGMNPISCLKSTSDNIHYVNLLPNQLLFSTIVVDYPYLQKIFQKISRGRGIILSPTKIALKILKSLPKEIKGDVSRLKSIVNKGDSLFRRNTLIQLGVIYA